MQLDSLSWFPGHMTKTRRMITANLSLVDAVVEILDARIPVSSRNPEMDRLTGGSSKRLSVLFRGLRFAGQQPYPRLFLSKTSQRTSPPRGAGTAGAVSADHGGTAAALRRSGRAFVSGQPPVNNILFLRVLVQCVTITKDHK